MVPVGVWICLLGNLPWVPGAARLSLHGLQRRVQQAGQLSASCSVRCARMCVLPRFFSLLFLNPTPVPTVVQAP